MASYDLVGDVWSWWKVKVKVKVMLEKKTKSFCISLHQRFIPVLNLMSLNLIINLCNFPQMLLKRNTTERTRQKL